jgi:transposase
VRYWLARRNKISILPVYTVDRYITSRTFKGTCTGEIFEDFIIDELLPLYNLYLGSWSVIIMDNAFVHHAIQDRVVKVARRQGVWVCFLPPYLPDFNLIKESFGT